MNILGEADQPGNQLDDYISRLSSILSQKAAGIVDLQSRLEQFQRRLNENNVLLYAQCPWSLLLHSFNGYHDANTGRAWALGHWRFLPLRWTSGHGAPRQCLLCCCSAETPGVWPKWVHDGLLALGMNGSATYIVLEFAPSLCLCAASMCICVCVTVTLAPAICYSTNISFFSVWCMNNYSVIALKRGKHCQWSGIQKIF